MTRDTALLWEIVITGFHTQEVPLVSFTLQLSAFTRKQLYRRLQQAYASGSLKLIKHIHALLALAQGQSVSDVAEMLALGEVSIRRILRPRFESLKSCKHLIEGPIILRTAQR